MREQLKPVSVTKLSLKLAQNGQKSANSKKLKSSLSYGWQRQNSLVSSKSKGA
jgi:hypothetical protein